MRYIISEVELLLGTLMKPYYKKSISYELSSREPILIRRGIRLSSKVVSPTLLLRN